MKSKIFLFLFVSALFFYFGFSSFAEENQEDVAVVQTKNTASVAEEPADKNITAENPQTGKSATSNETEEPPAEQSEKKPGEPAILSTISSSQPSQSTEKFQVDPSTGSASLTIPIDVAQGRKGIQPSVALMYNSGSANGILGVGWNLELGSIQISTKKGAPKYDGGDSFVLAQQGSTQELVNTSGNIYRPKIEGAFMKIEHIANAQDNYWLVTDKKGIKYYFGQNSASQQTDGSRIFKWCLDKVEDLNGNYMTISYIKYQESPGQIYPQHIYYTGNSQTGASTFADVEFSYETRTDTNLSYRTGFAVTTAKRLKEITVRADNNLQRSYGLSYENSTSTQRSLLTSITQYGKDGAPIPSTSFTYLETLEKRFNSQGRWIEAFGIGQDYIPFTGDFNADGFTDIMTKNSSGAWSVALNTGNNSFAAPSDWITNFGAGSDYIPFTGDFNGDGLTDIMVKNSSGLWSVALNTGNNSFAAPSDWITNFGAGSNDIPFTGDFNADGLTDIMSRDNSGCWKVALNTGNHSFTSTGSWIEAFGSGDASVYMPLTGDFNADGLTDIMIKNNNNGYWSVALNNGNSRFIATSSWIEAFGINPDYIPMALDLNSDGLSDAMTKNNSGLWSAALNTNNNRFANPSNWIENFGPGGQDQYVPMAGDFNADGLTDIMVKQNYNGYWLVALSEGSVTDLLSQIQNGIGAKTAISYIPSTRYDNTAGDGKCDLPFPVQVVFSTTVTDQVTGQSYATNYEYKNGFFDFQDKEFRGFGWVKTNQGNLLKNSSFEIWPSGPNNAPDGWGLNAGSAYREINHIKAGSYSLALNYWGYLGQAIPNYPQYIGKAVTFSCWVKAFSPNQARIEIYDGGYASSAYHSGSGNWELLTVTKTVSDNASTLTTNLYTDTPGTVYFDEAVFILGDSLSNYAYTETDFYTGIDNEPDYFKGRIKEQRSYDASGNLFAKTVNTWQAEDTNDGGEFVYLSKVDNFIFGGNSSGKRTQSQYSYEGLAQYGYGNLNKTIELGEVDINTGADLDSTDNRTTFIEYNHNNTLWIKDLPKHAYTYDYQGTIKSQKWFYYDNHAIDEPPTQGLLTKDEAWLFNPITTNSELITTNFAYDTYGNLISTTDALGRKASITYDSNLHLFPLKTANALGHTVKTIYYGVNDNQTDGDFIDPYPNQGSGLWGQAKAAIDPNNQTSSSVYDTFGRIIKTISPYDSIEYPASSIEYHLDSIPIKIISHQREVSGQSGTLDSISFYDGLGRLIQTKAESETPNQFIVSGQTEFNSSGLPEKKYLPKFSNNPMDVVDPIDASGPKATITYDAMARVVQSTNPDGTHSNVIYDDWTTTSIDENGHKQMSYSDAFGRLIKKEEYTGADGRSPNYPAAAYTLYATTLYAYDTLGNLTSTTDTLGHSTAITYDTFGRKIQMTDPDMGSWAYEYDPVGNLIKQTDAKQQEITFEYDALNRLNAKHSTQQPDKDVTYTYDAFPGNPKPPKDPFGLDAITDFSKGRLVQAQYQSNDNTQFHYDQLGREIQSIKKIDAVDYAVNRSYDAAGRLTSVTYPDNEAVNYSYNAAGQIGRVYSAEKTYVANVDYNSSGQIIHIEYGNGTVTDYTYDPKTLRLTNLRTMNSQLRTIQDLSYSYDSAGNILQITDAVNSGTQSFTYDDINRLKSANGRAYSAKSYAYNQIGNILNKDGLSFNYGRNAGPHAVTSLSDGTSFEYDSNGNMISTTNSERITTNYIFDPENRLTEVKKTTPSGKGGKDIYELDSENTKTVANFEYDGDGGRTKRIIYTTQDDGNHFKGGKDLKKILEMGEAGLKDLRYVFEFRSSFKERIKSVHPEIRLSGTRESGYSDIRDNFVPDTLIAGSPSPGLPDNPIPLEKDNTNDNLKLIQLVSQNTGRFTHGIEDLLLALKNTFSVKEAYADVVPVINTTIYVGSLYEVTNGAPTKHIFLGAQRIASIEHRGTSIETSYFHTNHLGSTDTITDDSGNKKVHYEYEPYGQVVQTNGTDSTDYKFTGKPLDDETGLYYYGARYYNPTIGRFITPDTIVQNPFDPQSLNRYTYCRNNPVNYVDPTGNKWSWKNFWKSFTQAVGIILSVAIIVIGVMTANPYLIASGALSLVNSATSHYQGGGWNLAHQIMGYGSAALAVAGAFYSPQGSPSAELGYDSDGNYVGTITLDKIVVTNTSAAVGAEQMTQIGNTVSGAFAAAQTGITAGGWIASNIATPIYNTLTQPGYNYGLWMYGEKNLANFFGASLDSVWAITGVYGAIETVAASGAPYWQYYTSNNPGYKTPWMTRGWQPPHQTGEQAAKALKLPGWNPGDAVRRANVKWWEAIAGPRRVSGGTGTEFYRGRFTFPKE